MASVTGWGPPSIAGSFEPINQGLDLLIEKRKEGELTSALSQMPKTAGGDPDYRGMAIKLMPTNPAASARLSQMADAADSRKLQERTVSLAERQAVDKPATATHANDDGSTTIYQTMPNGQVRVMGKIDENGVFTQGSAAGAAPTTAPAQPAAPPPEAVDMLKGNPALAPKFDETFGPGAAARALGQTAQAGTVTAPPPTTAAPAAPAAPGVRSPNVSVGQSGFTVDTSWLTNPPPGIPKKEWRKSGEAELTKKLADQGAARVKAAENARGFLPSLDRAIDAFEKLKEGGNIGPITGSGMFSGAARYLQNVPGINRIGAVAAAPLKDQYDMAAANLKLMQAQLMQGQGALSDSERRLLASTLPEYNTTNPEEAMNRLYEMRALVDQIYREAGRQPEPRTGKRATQAQP